MFLLMSAILIQGTEKSRTALKDYLMHQRKYLLPISYVKQHLALRKKFWLFNAELPIWSDGCSLLLQWIPAVWDPPTLLGSTNSLILDLCTNFHLCGNSFDTFWVGNFPSSLRPQLAYQFCQETFPPKPWRVPGCGTPPVYSEFCASLLSQHSSWPLFFVSPLCVGSFTGERPCHILPLYSYHYI